MLQGRARCAIVQVKTTERDGYTALQVTYGHKDAKKLTKPEAGHFAKAGVAARRAAGRAAPRLVDGFEVGQEITVDTARRRASGSTSPPSAGARASPAP